ncbi:hypothetical protein [Rhodosalinus sp.]|uniref:hypothetical protein n=1 Tax=Rhodosalinus sp. TaxID=2047741 RepID=UPI003562DCF2
MHLSQAALRGLRHLAGQLHQDVDLMPGGLAQAVQDAGREMPAGDRLALLHTIRRAIGDDAVSALRNPLRRAGAEVFPRPGREGAFWTEVAAGLAACQTPGSKGASR